MLRRCCRATCRSSPSRVSSAHVSGGPGPRCVPRTLPRPTSRSRLVDRDSVPSLTGLRWVQAPAAGVATSSFRRVRREPHHPHQLARRERQDHRRARDGRDARAREAAPVAARARRSTSGRSTKFRGTAAASRLGRHMGIVGLGSIGREVALLPLRSGCMSPAFADGRTSHRLLVDGSLAPDQLHELLRQSDVVVLAAPLTAATGLYRRGRAGRTSSAARCS